MCTKLVKNEKCLFGYELLNSDCGSRNYLAPEIIRREPYDGKAVDAWSAGVVLYNMLYGAQPFQSSNDQRLFRKITSGKFKFPSEVYGTKNSVSEKARDLITKLLTVDPQKRLKIKDCVHHPFLIQERFSSSKRESRENHISIPFQEISGQTTNR